MIQGYGKGQGLSGAAFDLFKTYFGSTSFNDDYLNQVVQACCCCVCLRSSVYVFILRIPPYPDSRRDAAALGTQGFALSNAAVKSEIVQKTVWDAIPVQAILSLTKPGSSPDDWDRAAALYLGDRTL